MPSPTAPRGSRAKPNGHPRRTARPPSQLANKKGPAGKATLAAHLPLPFRVDPNNRTQAIRDFLALYPMATPHVIQEGLARKGIEVSGSLIRKVKYTEPRQRALEQKVKQVPREPREKVQVAVVDLLDAKALVRRLGGVAAARELLEVLERLEEN